MECKDARNRIGAQVHRLDHRMNRYLEKQVQQYNVSEEALVHGWILRFLYENQEKDIFQKDIEKHFAIGRSTVTGIIKSMEKHGMVVRESVENDARLKKVVLTESGKKEHLIIYHAINELNKQMLDGVSDEEMDQMNRIMEKIHRNLDKIENEK